MLFCQRRDTHLYSSPVLGEVYHEAKACFFNLSCVALQSGFDAGISDRFRAYYFAGEMEEARCTRGCACDGNGVVEMEAQVRHCQDDGQGVCGWNTRGGCAGVHFCVSEVVTCPYFCRVLTSRL